MTEFNMQNAKEIRVSKAGDKNWVATAISHKGEEMVLARKEYKFDIEIVAAKYGGGWKVPVFLADGLNQAGRAYQREVEA